jgi:signal recognition particle subunit SRP54
MASRILGMGDVLTLIEKAEAAFDVEQAEAVRRKLSQGDFTLEDFLDQMRQVRKLGPLQNLVAMLPGVPKELRQADVDERELAGSGDICSMTPTERADVEDQRVAPAAHRQRQRHTAQRGRAAEAVQGGEPDDEGDGWPGKKGKRGRMGMPDLASLRDLGDLRGCPAAGLQPSNLVCSCVHRWKGSRPRVSGRLMRVGRRSSRATAS